jgi:uroporphyrin-III C-methyltransferase
VLARLSRTLDLPRFERGHVWLAGAGPGDPGLITALGLSAVAEADVILYDALVDTRLLALARPGAERIYAGKRAGVKSCKQTEISRTLVSLAQRKKRVLRLKGGDPMVFGRGAEEALALARARIPFRIVPGVTAGIGGLAYAGIPLTHRDINHSVTFITGHGADGKLPSLDWAAIAKASPTLVIYMGRKYLGEIAAKLMEAGLAADVPAALVMSATTNDQRVSVATLGTIAESAESGGAPAIIVIGENVLLRERMDWLGALAGRILDIGPLGRSALSA